MNKTECLSKGKIEKRVNNLIRHEQNNKIKHNKWINYRNKCISKMVCPHCGGKMYKGVKDWLLGFIRTKKIRCIDCKFALRFIYDYAPFKYDEGHWNFRSRDNEEFLVSKNQRFVKYPHEDKMNMLFNSIGFFICSLPFLLPVGFVCLTIMFMLI